MNVLCNLQPATFVATLALATCCTHSIAKLYAKYADTNQKWNRPMPKLTRSNATANAAPQRGGKQDSSEQGAARGGKLRSSVCACAEAAESKRSGKLGVNFYWRQLDVGSLDSAWNFMLLLLLLWTGSELGSQFSHYLIVVTGVKPLKWSLPRQTDWMGFTRRQRERERETEREIGLTVCFCLKQNI